MSLRDRIVKAGMAAQLSMKAVKVWGEDANIRRMTGTERDAFEASIFDASGKMDKAQFRAKLLVKTLADEAGVRLFTDTEIGVLSELPSDELVRLYDIAEKLNGLSKQDVEDLTKN